MSNVKRSRPEIDDHDKREDADVMKHEESAEVRRPPTDPVDKLGAEEIRPIKRVRTEVSRKESARDSIYKELPLSFTWC